MREAKKFFQIFGREENEVYIASLARGSTTERIGGAGKVLSGTDAAGEAVERKKRSSGWLCGSQDQNTE